MKLLRAFGSVRATACPSTLMSLYAGLGRALGSSRKVNVGKKKPRPEILEARDGLVPSWVKDEFPGRSSPYTEDELDLLEESTLEGIRDTASWKNLVDRVGEEEARRVLRSRIIMRDENARKVPRH